MRRTSLTVALMLICGCGAATGTGTGGQPAPAAASPIALSCTSGGDASSSWPSPSAASGTAPSIVSATVSGDSLVLTFAAGTPQFRVQPQPNSKFTLDPSGQPVSLAGSAGAKIQLSGFRGDRSNYDGRTSMTSSGPILLQANKIGDFEGVVTFGVGVSGSSCANVTSSGSTLTFRFIPAPQAAAGS